RTIVLLHGGVLHSAAYDDVWPMLCQRFKVIRYDRRGYGASPPAAQPYRPVDDLAVLLKALDPPHATLVGSSSGSGLAVDYALAHPEQVDRLVLAGPW
ncbi:alpha/beta fold hydrolase, partial [Caulobacter sp. 602-1]|uniref:alpha/beta fold hydrolase n=1 Tax=Caulobacter sp. 602-1 TaxID=2492472 RepID=UPI000F9B5A9D